MAYNVYEIRPAPDGGAWVRVIVDLPARHDPDLSESIEINLFGAQVMGVSVSAVIEKAKRDAQLLLRSSGVG